MIAFTKIDDLRGQGLENTFLCVWMGESKRIYNPFTHEIASRWVKY